MSITGLYSRYMQTFGELMGTKFDILRPNYTVANNTPALIVSGLKYRCDPANPQFAEPKFREVDWYSMFGNRSIVHPGDILRKTTSDGGMTPPITVLHYGDIKEFVGFRTSRIGKLTNSIDDTPIYTEVYFDFLGVGYPGSSLNKKLERTMQIPGVRAVLYKRDNLINLRTQLIETDYTVQVPDENGTNQPYQRKWLIEQIDFSGNCMILTLGGNQGD